MTSSTAFLGALFAKAAEPTIPLPTNRKLTKAGVALDAEAILKLQQLADWMELAVDHRQPDPTVELGYENGITRLSSSKTKVSTFGALVQMFKPFKLIDAFKHQGFDLYRIPFGKVAVRSSEILGITHHEMLALLRYTYGQGYDFPGIIQRLRDIK